MARRMEVRLQSAFATFPVSANRPGKLLWSDALFRASSGH